MSETSWVLSSIERDVHVERFKIDDDDVKGTPKGWSVRKRTLRGGRREGVELIEINNGDSRSVVTARMHINIRNLRYVHKSLGACGRPAREGAQLDQEYDVANGTQWGSMW